jgi:triosephosphate isomerase
VSQPERPLIGVSLKMYLGHFAQAEWCESVVELPEVTALVDTGQVDLVIVPTFPSLPFAVGCFSQTRVEVGAQDLFWDARGPFTGEVSGIELREVGCAYVEVGHAERRHLFGETDDTVRRKAAAAVRTGLIPIICVGELRDGEPDDAIASCIAQLEVATHDIADSESIVVAYEPAWAIGAGQPAPVDHVAAVCSALRQMLRDQGRNGARVIYGGSAGPGLLGELADSVSGLFLGRFAHDPDVLGRVLAEAATRRP